MTHTTIEGVRAPTLVPHWHTAGDGSPSPVITHATGAPLPVLFPPTQPGQQTPAQAWLTTRASDAPHRIGRPLNEAPKGIETAEFKTLEPELQEKLLRQIAPLFKEQWAIVDPRYREEAGVIQTLKERSTSDKPLDRLYVKHLDGRLVATASLCPRDNPAFDNPYNGSDNPDRPLSAGTKYADGFLVDVYTAEAFENQGNATGLVRRIFADAAPHTDGQLHLYCDEALVPFYLKLGFGVVGNEIANPEEVQKGEAPVVETIMRFPAPSLHQAVPPKQDGKPLPLLIHKPLPMLPDEAMPDKEEPSAT